MSLHRITILAAVLLTACCSVKEDRSNCPCIVSVKTQSSDCSGIFFYDGDVLLESKMMEAYVLCTGENSTAIRRCHLTTAVVTGCDSLELTDSTVISACGQQFPKVNGLVSVDDAHREFLTVEGILHKQHCVISVMVRSSNSIICPYRARFLASCNGLVLRSMEGACGKFCYETSFDTDYRCQVILPRQKDNDGLYMELLSIEGENLGKINLGRYFLEAGYDWNADDLDDIDIIIDYSLCTITININEWNHVILRYEI